MEQSKQKTKIDPLEFRKALGRFASGVTVVTTVREEGAHEESMHGMTANAFVSVSLDPPLVLVSVDNRSRMRELLTESGRYGVNILSREQEAFSQHFAGRPKEGLEIPLIRKEGMPLLEGAIAHLVCKVVDTHLAGDHTLFIGEVEHLEYADGAPLLFYSGDYGCLEVQVHSNDWLMW